MTTPKLTPEAYARLEKAIRLLMTDDEPEPARADKASAEECAEYEHFIADAAGWAVDNGLFAPHFVDAYIQDCRTAPSGIYAKDIHKYEHFAAWFKGETERGRQEYHFSSLKEAIRAIVHFADKCDAPGTVTAE